MIAKIHKTENLLSGLNYNLNKIAKGGAYVLHGSSIPFNFDQTRESYRDKILAEFSHHLEILNRRGRTKKPILHISLNPSPDDSVSDMTCSYLVEDYLREMGFSGQPFVVFKHRDTGRPHVHILTTNVKSDGTKIDERFSHRRNVKVCEKLERDYGLSPAKFSKREALQDSPNSAENFSLKNCLFELGKGDSGTQIRKIIRTTLQKYHFETDREYKALLRLFGVEADFRDAKAKAIRGVVFYGLNSEGQRVTKPLRSYLIEKGLLKKIETKFQKSGAALSDVQTRRSIKNRLDLVKTADSRVDFYEKLSEQNMDIVFRRTDTGRIYGATVIDHDFGMVLNGSKLGKAYAANVFNDLFHSFENTNTGNSPAFDLQQHDILPVLSKPRDTAALTFFGSFGSFGHYRRVGDREEESENDKLNREIKKRKKRKSNID